MAEDMKNGIVMYEKTNGFLPKVVLVNIPRKRGNNCNMEGLEAIKDMFFYSGKYEGGMVCGASPHVMVFSNFLPEYDSISEDRWHIWNIREETE